MTCLFSFKCYLPVVYQYSVFDEVKYVVKVSQVSYVDDLSPGEKKRKFREFSNKLFKKNILY